MKKVFDVIFDALMAIAVMAYTTVAVIIALVAVLPVLSIYQAVTTDMSITEAYVTVFGGFVTGLNKVNNED
jgi:hypothetical protein